MLLFKRKKKSPQVQRFDCGYCHGEGKFKCRHCGGTGHKLRAYENYSSYYQTTPNYCSYCNGTGYTSCSDCHGVGYTIIEKVHTWHVCPTCNGAGKYYTSERLVDGRKGLLKKCSNCNGTGTVRKQI